MSSSKIMDILDKISLWVQSSSANFIWMDIFVCVGGFIFFLLYIYIKIVFKTLLKYTNSFKSTEEVFIFFKSIYSDIKSTLLSAIINTTLLTTLFSMLSCAYAIKGDYILRAEHGTGEVLLPVKGLMLFNGSLCVTNSFLLYKGIVSLLFLSFLIVNRTYFLKSNKITSTGIIFLVVNFYSLVFIAAANSMVVFMVLLEVYTLSFFYILAASALSSKKIMLNPWIRLEAFTALLYFFFTSVVGSALVFYGFSQVYFWEGSIFLTKIFSNAAYGISVDNFSYKISWLFILGGFLAKAGMVPYHFPAFRVAIFTPTPIFFYGQIFPKVAFFYILISLSKNFGLVISEVFIYSLGAVSILIGTHIMVNNRHLKKFIFGSSLSTNGALLYCLATVDVAFDLFLPFWVVYGSSLLIINIAACRSFKSLPNDIYIDDVVNFKSPILRGIAVANIASLAGLAPFSGFFLKAYFIKSTVFAGSMGPAIILALLLIVNAMGYVKVIMRSNHKSNRKKHDIVEITSWAFVILNATVAALYLVWF